MKLQISFDMTDLEKALEVAKQVEPYATSFEIGSLLLFKYGVKAIEQFRQTFPDKTLMADAKIVDRGKQAIKLLSDAGADWFTVMAGTSKNVIHTVSTVAGDANKKVMLDLIDACSLGQSALEAKSMGIDALLFHKPYEEDSLEFLDKWDMVRGNSDLPIFVSGKVSRDIVEKVKAIAPDGIVISKAITDADNPEEEAKFYHDFFNS